jgi:hypothetical protein
MSLSPFLQTVLPQEASSQPTAGKAIAVWRKQVSFIIRYSILVNKVNGKDKDSVLSGVNIIASLVKRVILGTFQGRFDNQYLQRLLDEYVFRFNRRTTKTLGKRFWRIMQRVVVSPTVTIRNLVLASTGV